MSAPLRRGMASGASSGIASSGIAPRSGARSPRRAGFTLVELMVSLSAGLVVAAAAYSLARNSLDVFQHESRLFAAQFSAMTGMTRLAADIRRAGFMTSADPVNDPFRCGDMTSPAADQRRLRSVVIVGPGLPAGDGNYTADSAVTTGYDAVFPAIYDTLNTRRPDRIRLAANYSTNEIFDLSPSDASDGDKLNIDVDTAASARVWRDATAGNGPHICGLFLGGTAATLPRYAALTTSVGQTTLVKVTACTFTNPGVNYGSVQLTVTYLQTATRCKEGLKTIAPVSLIDYSLANIADATDAVATGLPTGITQMTVPVAIGITGDDTRMELVRREIDANGVVVPGSGEIVSEYVVDLKFAARMRPAGAPAAPVLTDFDTAALNCTTGTTGTCAGSAPQRMRSLLVRLGTRARAPDATSVGDPAVPLASRPLKRFAVLPATGPRTRFARVRNFSVEIPLPNMAGYIW